MQKINNLKRQLSKVRNYLTNLLREIKPKNQAQKWLNEAVKKDGDECDSGLPPISGRIYKKDDFTIHRFKDGSEIICTYGLYWTREVWDYHNTNAEKPSEVAKCKQKKN